MFCEAIAHSLAVARADRFWRPPARRADEIGPSLYASVWHCPECRASLRVFAPVHAIVTGKVRNDCPDCGGEMTASSVQARPARAAAPRRPIVADPAPSASAFAA
jgi:hypothetical protein